MAEENAQEVQAAGGEMDVIQAIKIVLRTSLTHDGLRRGLHESTKALDRGIGQLCILASDCDNEEYSTLIEALCTEGGVHLIKADKGTELGEWVGLAKLAEDGTVRKAVRCSVAVVTEFGEETAALKVVLDYVKNNA